MESDIRFITGFSLLVALVIASYQLAKAYWSIGKQRKAVEQAEEQRKKFREGLASLSDEQIEEINKKHDGNIDRIYAEIMGVRAASLAVEEQAATDRNTMSMLNMTKWIFVLTVALTLIGILQLYTSWSEPLGWWPNTYP